MNALDAICATPLDKTSDVPLYLQLKLRLMGLIATHAFDGQTPLPAEADICRALGLSRSTVRRCFRDLVDEGRVVRRRGKGTFVARYQQGRTTDVALNFSARMEALGKAPSSRILSLRQVSGTEVLRHRLRLGEKDGALWEVRRLRIADGVPMEINTAYVPESVCPALTRGRLERSLYACVAEDAGLLPTYEDAYLEAVVLDQDDVRRVYGPVRGVRARAARGQEPPAPAAGAVRLGGHAGRDVRPRGAGRKRGARTAARRETHESRLGANNEEREDPRRLGADQGLEASAPGCAACALARRA